MIKLPKPSVHALAIAAALFLTAPLAHADEGGIGFWLPGQYGSLIAAPQQPGWAFGAIGLHDELDAGGAVVRSRQITIGDLPTDIDVSLNADLDAQLDIVFFAPAYTFANPVWGGQLTLTAGLGVGRSEASIAGDLTVRLEDGTIIERSGSVSDDATGISDLYPAAQLRWNRGVHNYMVYVMGDVPIGEYDSSNLANIGIGHGAIDGGGAYTYFNPQTGHELSAASGLTYNFENDDTGYQNGIDWHLDWSASQFLSPQTFVGLSGYFYQQLTDDDGGPNRDDGFKSGVMGIGPQAAYLFPIGGSQGVFKVNGFVDMNAQNRAEGWSLWLTFAISPRAPAHQ